MRYPIILLGLVVLGLVLTTGCCFWPYAHDDGDGVCYRLVQVCNKVPTGGYDCTMYKQNLIRQSVDSMIPISKIQNYDFCNPYTEDFSNGGYSVKCYDDKAFVPVTPTPTPTVNPYACIGSDCYSNPATATGGGGPSTPTHHGHS